METSDGRGNRLGGSAALARCRRGGGCGNDGMLPDGGTEGPRHAGNAYACTKPLERKIACHDRGNLLSHMAYVCVLSRLEASSPTRQHIFDQRFWLDLYEDWRVLTSASTSGPNCSSLRAPIPGMATSAASSVGNDSAMAIKVLSVNTT